VTKSDPRVDAYIAKSAPFAKPILRHIRALVRGACPEAGETIKWGMPSFVLDGKILCGMAAFKAHCTFGFWNRDVRRAFRQRGAEADEAMGDLGRITALDELPPAADLRRAVKLAASLIREPAPARTPQARRRARALPVPTDFAAALRKNAKAKAQFESFSPSHRNEYVAWITEAKRAETRVRRLATAVEWLSEGKHHNWRYESC
jgi:uncharacterized protein YdeI (YjbR/CyaY-like superfamily)